MNTSIEYNAKINQNSKQDSERLGWETNALQLGYMYYNLQLSDVEFWPA